MVRAISGVGAKPSVIPWSEYQKKIFEFIKYGRGHGFVIARAGSGKTTVAVEGFKYTPANAAVIFLAFNKAIQKELESRVPSHVTVKTYHSFGLAAIRSQFRNVDVKKDKTERILIDIIPSQYHARLLGICTKLVSLAKQSNVQKADDILDIALHHGMLVYNPETFLENIRSYVMPALEQSKKNLKEVDFDDMCWLPCALDLKLPKYDFVCVDEAQDTSTDQTFLLTKALRPAGRLLGVGDSRQAIYAFRGASVDAVPRMIDKFKATVLPMPITYRCCQAVVRLAQEIVPDIEAAPGALEGSVDFYTYDNFLDDVLPGDMVLCRTTAPLVEPCYSLIQNGIKASIRGSATGSQLIDLIHQMRARSIDDLFGKLQEFQDKQIAVFTSLGRPEAAQKAIDDIEAIHAFAHGVRTVDSLISKIKSMFSDDIQDVVFSTIHKAKGLEADNVWLLRPDLLPHPLAKLAWEIEQENNLKYVAYTRAKISLNIVKDGYPKSQRMTIRRKAVDEHILNTPIANKLIY